MLEGVSTPASTSARRVKFRINAFPCSSDWNPAPFGVTPTVPSLMDETSTNETSTPLPAVSVSATFPLPFPFRLIVGDSMLVGTGRRATFTVSEFATPLAPSLSVTDSVTVKLPSARKVDDPVIAAPDTFSVAGVVVPFPQSMSECHAASLPGSAKLPDNTDGVAGEDRRRRRRGNGDRGRDVGDGHGLRRVLVPAEGVGHGKRRGERSVVVEDVVRDLAPSLAAVAEVPAIGERLGASEIGAPEVRIGARRRVELERRTLVRGSAHCEAGRGRTITRLNGVLIRRLEQRQEVVAGGGLDLVDRREVLLPRIVPNAGDVGHVDGEHGESGEVVPRLEVGDLERHATDARSDDGDFPGAVGDRDLPLVFQERESVRLAEQWTGHDADGLALSAESPTKSSNCAQTP